MKIEANYKVLIYLSFFNKNVFNFSHFKESNYKMLI